MRIHFLLTQDLDSPGGLGRYWPMAHALAARGHQVRISALHSNYQNLQTKRFNRDSVIVEYVAPMHIIKVGSSTKYYSSIRLAWVILRATWALTRAAFSYPVDVIYVGKPHPMNTIAGLLAAKVKGVILSIDCDDYEAETNRYSNRWQKRIVAFFETKMPRLANIVSTNTNFMKTMLEKWGCRIEQILELPNGIDKERYQKPDPNVVNQLREELGLKDKRVVLFIGSLSLANHPVDLLLRAFVQVSQRCPDAFLLLVGGGGEYQQLIALSQELGIDHCVKFTGRVLPERVVNYYALGDVSVDPVIDDDCGRGRSPLKLFESWACGVPFVTGPVGERISLIGDPPAGFLAKKAGDVDSLADAILQVLVSKELAEEFRRRGYIRVQPFTWDRLVIKLEQAFKTLP